MKLNTKRLRICRKIWEGLQQPNDWRRVSHSRAVFQKNLSLILFIAFQLRQTIISKFSIWMCYIVLHKQTLCSFFNHGFYLKMFRYYLQCNLSSVLRQRKFEFGKRWCERKSVSFRNCNYYSPFLFRFVPLVNRSEHFRQMTI